MLTQDDHELLLFLATSSASLDRSPKKNWVENAGNLPPYVRKIARAIEKSGKPLSSAIPIAISRIKKWAAGGDDVNADTRAKAAKALAQWEALKAKNKAKKIVKASQNGHDTMVYLAGGHLVSDVAENWDRLNAYVSRRMYEATGVEHPYTYVEEVWTDFIVVRVNPDYRTGNMPFYCRVPYTRDGGGDIVFGEPELVTRTFVPLNGGSEEEITLSDNERELLGSLGEETS